MLIILWLIKMSASTSSDNAISSENKSSDRTKRLRELKMRRIESKKMNRAEVVEEDRKGKLPKNWENRQQRAEYKLNEIQARKECSEKGKDYDREKCLHISATDAERKDVAKKRKKDPDMGFSSKCLLLVILLPFSYCCRHVF